MNPVTSRKGWEDYFSIFQRTQTSESGFIVSAFKANLFKHLQKMQLEREEQIFLFNGYRRREREGATWNFRMSSLKVNTPKEITSRFMPYQAQTIDDSQIESNYDSHEKNCITRMVGSRISPEMHF